MQIDSFKWAELDRKKLTISVSTVEMPGSEVDSQYLRVYGEDDEDNVYLLYSEEVTND